MLSLMGWHPPWSLADRARWARARPWLAGFYFGVLMALAFGAYFAFRSGIKLAILLGVSVWAMGWPMFGMAMKHRWGLRPDVEDAAVPTLRRPWVQASDRSLSVLMWIFGLSSVVLALGLVTGGNGTTGGRFVVLALDILFALTIWSERRRRSTR